MALPPDGEERLLRLAEKAGLGSTLDLAFVPDAVLLERGLSEEELLELRTLLKATRSWAAPRLEAASCLPKQGTGCASLDRLLGGGFAFGSLMGIVGERGVGKSTLALQVALVGLASAPEGVAAYISGEAAGFRPERAAQLIRARGLGDPLEVLERLLVLRAREPWELVLALLRLRERHSSRLRFLVLDEVHACFEALAPPRSSLLARYALFYDLVHRARELCGQTGACGLLVHTLAPDPRTGARRPLGYRFYFPLLAYLLLERSGGGFVATLSLTGKYARYRLGERGLEDG
jgi:hypothetical protein